MEYREFISSHFLLSNEYGEFISRQLESDMPIELQRCIVQSGFMPKIHEELRDGLSPWPVILSSKTRASMQDIVSKLGHIIAKSLPLARKHLEALFNKHYHLPKELLVYLDNLALPLLDQFGRYDAILHDGEFKVIEYNVATNIGGWHTYKLLNEFIQVVDSEHDLTMNTCVGEFIEHLYTIGEKYKSTDTEPVRVLFEAAPGDSLIAMQMIVPIFNELARDSQLQIEFLIDSEFEQLTVTEHGALFGGKEVHVVLAPIHELDTALPSVVQLTHHHFNQKLAFPDNPVYLLIGNKSNFALMHHLKEAGIFTDFEAELITKLIPWSCWLDKSECDQQKMERIASQKDNYVLKKNISLGGCDVIVGKYTATKEWQGALQNALSEGDWIVQQFFESDGFLAPDMMNEITVHDFVWGMFDFARTYSGCIIRMAQKESYNGVLNAKQGAQTAAVLNCEV